ncbi:MAG: thiol-disulfide isomerase [Lutibacter sp.]|nr:MAG: thiol-disulfide isomerase [Lutibacter sp.]
MKKIIISSCLILFTIFSVNAQKWLTDIEEAKNIASKKNQNIILVFEGSDWCAPCIKLERNIFNTSEFKTYVKKHFTLLKADFPRKKKNKLESSQQKKNNLLMEKYNKHGYFPYVAVINKYGKLLGSTGYKKMNPSEYINLLSSF